MKQKTRTTALGLLLISTTFLPLINSAQTKGSQVIPSVTDITQEDYETLLALNGMKIYKFPVKIPEDQKCSVMLYEQRFDSQGMISDETIWGSRSPHKKVVDRKPVLNEQGEHVYQPLDGIRFVVKEEGRGIDIGIKLGTFEIPPTPLKIDSIYSEKHYVRSFSIPDEFPIGSDIPLVLIGSSWKVTDDARKNVMSKFCWSEMEGISPDFSQEGFKKMPHYIIFGIRIVEPQ